MRVGPVGVGHVVEEREGHTAIARERPRVVRRGERAQIVDQVRPRALALAGAVLQHHRQRQAPHPRAYQTALGRDRLQRGGQLAGRVQLAAHDAEPQPRAGEPSRLPPALRRQIRAFVGPLRQPLEPPRALWRGIPDAERDFVLDVALFDRLDPELIDEVTGEGNAARRIASRGTLAWLWSGSERGAGGRRTFVDPRKQSLDVPPLSGGLFALRRSHEPRKLPVHQTGTRLYATRYVRVIGVQRKKPIEVALPLDAINRAAAREKSIRYGHPSTLQIREESS